MKKESCKNRGLRPIISLRYRYMTTKGISMTYYKHNNHLETDIKAFYFVTPIKLTDATNKMNKRAIS